MRATWTVLAAVAICMTSTGCVSKKRYNELQSQYDDLNTQYASLQQSEAGLRMEAADLEEHVTMLRNSNEYLGSFYADLLSEFRPQLESDEMEVIVYPDRMSLALAQDVTFGTGASKLTGVGDETLAKLADLVKRHPDRRFNVEGHTDDVPIDTARYGSNWELGAARAVAVVEALIAQGVPAERLAATSYGETQPLAENGSSDGRQVNRRVEIAFQPTLDELPGHQMLVDAAREVTFAKDADRTVVTEPERPTPSTSDEELPPVPADTRGDERANDG
jgi:chemotaxis protein MotB